MRFLLILTLLTLPIACGSGSGSGSQAPSSSSIPVDLVHVEGPDAYTAPESIRVLRLALALMQYDLGIPFEEGDVISVDDPSFLLDDIEPLARAEHLRKLREPLEQLGALSKNRLTIVVLPPHHPGDGYLWFSGIARGLCTYGRKSSYSLVFTGPYSSDGGDRERSTVAVIAHELGHLLGARHKETLTVMRPQTALTLGLLDDECGCESEIHFSLAAVEEMKECTRIIT